MTKHLEQMQGFLYRCCRSAVVCKFVNISQSLGQSTGPESAICYPCLNIPAPFISTAILMHLFIMALPMSHETKGLPSEIQISQ